MQKLAYDAVYQGYIKELDIQLRQNAQSLFASPSVVADAAWYSLSAGGKRVRGTLTCAVAQLLGQPGGCAAQFGAAVEMLHCYSLIHDDLPCMDNADTRRGKAACHKQFGEWTALLAGDALLTAAFDALASADAAPDKIAAATGCLARAAGPLGMVYGQELDLAFEHKTPTRADLEQIHRHKTGALIDAAVQLGAIAAGGQPDDREALAHYSRRLGLVFQIVDDILDVTATAAQMGKPVGNDEHNDKITFATCEGIDAAMEQARRLTQEACEILRGRYGEKSDFLVALAEGLLIRQN